MVSNSCLWYWWIDCARGEGEGDLLELFAVDGQDGILALPAVFDLDALHGAEALGPLGAVLAGCGVVGGGVVFVVHLDLFLSLIFFWPLLLAVSHFLNIKYCRLFAPDKKAPCCHSDSCKAHEKGD